MQANDVFDPMQTVLERFAVLAQLSEEELPPFAFLCSDAWTLLLQSRRSQEELSEQDAALLCPAAAALAFYHFALLQAARPEPEFSAGDVRVSPPMPDLKAAKSFWSSAQALAAPLLLDNAFVFRAFGGDCPAPDEPSTPGV